MAKNPIEKGQRLKIEKIPRFVSANTGNHVITIIVDVVDQGVFDGETFFKIKRGHIEDWITESELKRKCVSRL